MVDGELSQHASVFLGRPVQVSWAVMADAIGKAYTLPDGNGIALHVGLRGQRVKSLAILLHECGHIANGDLPSREWARKQAKPHNPENVTPDVFDKSWLRREHAAWGFAIRWADAKGWRDVAQYCRECQNGDLLRYTALELDKLNSRLERLA